MQNELVVRPAADGDVDLFAGVLRGVDLREIAATSLAPPAGAIARCLAASDRTWVGLLDGEPMFISGISRANFMSARRAPWLLGTPLIDTNPRPFLRYTRAAMPGLLAAHPWMENHIDARSTRTIAWLRWLGFVIHDAKPYGALGRPFHRFSIGGPHL